MLKGRAIALIDDAELERRARRLRNRSAEAIIEVAARHDATAATEWVAEPARPCAPADVQPHRDIQAASVRDADSEHLLPRRAELID